MLDFGVEGGRYWFRFGSGDDLGLALDLFQQLVPLANREWDPKTKLWGVPLTYKAALALIFENGQSCTDPATSQPALPGMP